MLILVGLMMTGLLTAQEPQLEVGEKVPPLEVAEWLHGGPVTSFEPNMLYLVEFTHLACKPCREAIPHLTDLQKKYAGYLEVVSIYTYYPRDKRTEAAYRSAILTLKENMGDRMEYTIALDTRDRSVNLSWGGIPAFPVLYLIDSKGRLVWQGSGDFAALDYVVQQSMGGHTQTGELQRRQERFEEAYSDNIDNQKKRPLNETLAHADSLIVAFPERRDFGLRLKFYAYLKHDREKANHFLRTTQAQYQHWTFASEIFDYDPYLGLEPELALENIYREIRDNRDSTTVANLNFKKAFLLVWYGRYAEALTLLRDVEVSRYSLGKMSPVLREMSNGWRHVALFGLMKSQGEAAATYWLTYYTKHNELPYFATTTIMRVFKEKLEPEQRQLLQIYLKKQLEQRLKAP
ncbi:TlpA family protein disulfide reductase [Parapedobacter soli]|uniref:TlpA family protein disulfide reductase n=1 Tax=Parapedobacter soli TaxID=416955 RepID=UPI0021C62176|nr:hypothetical protein [Parapedobacter soli]